MFKRLIPSKTNIRALNKLRAHLKERKIIGGGGSGYGTLSEKVFKPQIKNNNLMIELLKKKPKPTPEEKEKAELVKQVPF